MKVLELFCVIIAALIAYKTLSVLLLDPLLFKLRNAIYGDSSSASNTGASASGGFPNTGARKSSQ